MKKFGIFFLIGLVSLIILISVIFRVYFPKSVGPYEGKYRIRQLSDSVEIMFDEKGIPQIFTKNNRDLFFAIGWVHASERLFQMDLMRHLVKGNLSELFGRELLMLDTATIKNEFYQRAREAVRTLQPETKDLLNAYLDGVNRRIHLDKPLPPEFILLHHKPDVWKLEDCLAIFMFQTWFSHALMDHDTSMIHLYKTFGDSILPYLSPYYAWSPVTVDIPSSVSMMPVMGIGSNSAVISKQKSVSGFALHESDPHLLINQIPNFWYIAGMHSEEGIHFVGVTLPGLPFGVMGHTDKIAFSFTVASVDIIDYYEFPIMSEDPLTVRTQNGQQPVHVTIDTIRVRGADPYPFTYYKINGMPVWKRTDSSLITYQWAGFDKNPAEAATAALQLMQASSFQEFREAVTHLGALDANWVYSDIEGNIGYQLGTPIPVRKVQQTHILLDGTDPNTYWKGYYPLDQTPFSYNPPKGWLATCNNQIVGQNWLYTLHGWYDPYRIIRANQKLSLKKKYSIEDLHQFQVDQISGRFIKWKDLFFHSSLTLPDPLVRKSIARWSGNMLPGQPAPYLFVYWWHLLPRFLFYPRLHDGWKNGKYIMNAVLTNPAPFLTDDPQTEKTEDLLAVSRKALDSAYAIYKKNKNNYYSYLIIEHPLSKVKILDYLLHLNRGPFITYGDGGTLNANWMKYNPKYERFETIVGPSMRFLLDWQNPDSFSIYTNLGQSGNPYSPYYDAFLKIWRRGQTWTVPFSRNEIEKRTKSTLILHP